MSLNAALAAGATLVAAAFAISTFDRWLRRRAPHDAAWSVSLLFFAIGSFALWWAESRGWSMGSFRVFYAAGAILNVPWLALGTVHLLFDDKVARRVRTNLIALSGAAVGIVLVAPADPITDPTEMPQGSELFGVAPRVFAAVGSGLAALVIIVGAVWSIVRVMQHRNPAMSGRVRTIADPRRHALANGLIAVGTLVLSASGTLAGRLGKDTAFAVTLLTGVVILFVGFLTASTRPARSERPTQKFAEVVVG